MPLAVAYATVTVDVLAADSVTVKVAAPVPALPSATATSPIDSVGSGAASSFVIVPRPTPSASVAPEGLDSATVNVSLGSTVVSPFTTTAIVFVVCPAVKVSVPDWAT